MKKHVIFLVIGVVMLLAAVAFVWYAVNNPLGSFPLPLETVYTIYALYIAVMIAMFVLALVFCLGERKARKQENR